MDFTSNFKKNNGELFTSKVLVYFKYKDDQVIFYTNDEPVDSGVKIYASEVDSQNTKISDELWGNLKAVLKAFVGGNENENVSFLSLEDGKQYIVQDEPRAIGITVDQENKIIDTYIKHVNTMIAPIAPQDGATNADILEQSFLNTPTQDVASIQTVEQTPAPAEVSQPVQEAVSTEVPNMFDVSSAPNMFDNVSVQEAAPSELAPTAVSEPQGEVIPNMFDSQDNNASVQNVVDIVRNTNNEPSLVSDVDSKLLEFQQAYENAQVAMANLEIKYEEVVELFNANVKSNQPRL